jgi:integrase
MKVGKRASSWKTDITNLSRHVQPLIGKQFVTDLKKSDVARMLKDITDGLTAGDFKTRRQGLARVRGGAGSAGRVLTTLRAMLNWAIAQDILVINPARGLSLPKAPPMERFLSEEEATHLFATLANGELSGAVNPQHANLIRLLLLTGARKSELMGLRWDELDLARNRIVLPPSRTKAGSHNGNRRIPLNAAAKSIVQSMASTRSEFVFPADRTDLKHMTGIQKTWKRVCEAAALGNMRLHDLRHSFASFAIANGENIVVIAAALGHATTRMTERYLHLRDDDINALAERTGQRIMLGFHANARLIDAGDRQNGANFRGAK